MRAAAEVGIDVAAENVRVLGQTAPPGQGGGILVAARSPVRIANSKNVTVRLVGNLEDCANDVPTRGHSRRWERGRDA